MTILSKNDQRGRSMVEMLGVLAIIGVLSVGGISGYSKAMAKFKLTKAQDQMAMILINIRTAFATSSSYDGLNNAAAISFGIAPNEMFTGSTNYSTLASNATINNAFGGSTIISSCNAGTCGTLPNSDADAQYFSITMTGLGRESCISLASSDWGTDGLVSVMVNTEEKKANELPIKLTDAGEFCKGTGQYSTITWTYY